MTTTAASVSRPVKTARHRLSKIASARDTISGFDHDTDIVGLTHGQFSLLDLIEATLEITGPAHLAIATWSAGLYDTDAAARFAADGRLLSVRFVMDSASQKRGQASTVDIADLFGPQSIRTTRSHAKFAILTNAHWYVVITSSMNLNLNARVEQFEMTDCPQRAAFFLAWVDDLFQEVPPGGLSGQGLSGHGWRGEVRPGEVRHGGAGRGLAGQARQGPARFGVLRNVVRSVYSQ